jgi:hypothetical protein
MTTGASGHPCCRGHSCGTGEALRTAEEAQASAIEQAEATRLLAIQAADAAPPDARTSISQGNAAAHGARNAARRRLAEVQALDQEDQARFDALNTAGR